MTCYSKQLTGLTARYGVSVGLPVGIPKSKECATVAVDDAIELLVAAAVLNHIATLKPVACRAGIFQVVHQTENCIT